MPLATSSTGPVRSMVAIVAVPVYQFTYQAAAQLVAPQGYIEAVLQTGIVEVAQ